MHLSLRNCSFVTQSLHNAGVLCLMRPAAGRICAAVMQGLLLYSYLLFTQILAFGIICSMHKMLFVCGE